MTMTSEERETFQRDLKGLSEIEIKERLEQHIFRGEKRTIGEQHLEQRELAGGLFLHTRRAMLPSSSTLAVLWSPRQ
jgi:hypothetical protein